MLNVTQANTQSRIEASMPTIMLILSTYGAVRVTLGRRTWLTSNRSEVVAVLARGGHVDM